jgi:hypothetical protein
VLAAGWQLDDGLSLGMRSWGEVWVVAVEADFLEGIDAME